MALNTANRDAIDYRRERVAQLRLRGLSERAITTQLGVEGVVNPATQAPYDLATIHGDLKALRARWQTAAAVATTEQHAALLAEVREVRRAGWEGAGRAEVVDGLVRALTDGDAGVRAAAARSLGLLGMPDLTNVLKGLDTEAKLVGAYAPTKIAPTDAAGTGPYAPPSSLAALSLEDRRTLADILRRAVDPAAGGSLAGDGQPA